MFFFSLLIVTPIKFLAHAADSLRQSKDPSASLRRLPDRKDEIRQLSTSLVALTGELQSRIKAQRALLQMYRMRSNPLRSLRSAVETIARIDDARQQQRLMDAILNDATHRQVDYRYPAASRLDAEIIWGIAAANQPNRNAVAMGTITRSAIPACCI